MTEPKEAEQQGRGSSRTETEQKWKPNQDYEKENVIALGSINGGLYDCQIKQQ